MSTRHAVFLVNLLQDVNVLRPLVHLAARDLGMRTEILMSDAFPKRDIQGLWREEIAAIARDTLSPVFLYTSPWEALEKLQGKAGVLVAGSESNLPAHRHTHDVYRVAPPEFVRITLQHGYECIGFRQSRDHDLAHGRTVTFAADVICGWAPVRHLTHLAPSQAGKLRVTGPTAVLQMPKPHGPDRPARGIVCENLHSVRLNVAGDFKTDFIGVFDAFSRTLKDKGKAVTLRPHPGGQYVLKNDVPLAGNVMLNANPMYRVDLSRFSYGLSAPSSVLIDMLLADVPVAVWRDAGGTMDADNYAGLETVSSLEDWLAFAERAEADPAPFRARQKAFLDLEELVVEPAAVHRRFATLLAGIERIAAAARQPPPRRILFVSNSHLATLQLSWEKPLAGHVVRGEIAVDFVNEAVMGDAFGRLPTDTERRRWLEDRFFAFRPTVVVFCRYSGPGADEMVALARRLGAATLLHIDDDLLHVPAAIGDDKTEFHNRPERLASLRHLFETVDLVYCSTARLRERFAEMFRRPHIMHGEIYCASTVMRAAEERPVRVAGYMGFGHARDFAMVAPVVAEFLRRHPEMRFELFGTFPDQPELRKFGDRLVMRQPIRDYAAFLGEFAGLGWDIGICPLERHPFNLKKANTKWVEYTAVGTAVVASRDTVYDDVCADGCGLLADRPEEWLAALDALCDPRVRHDQVLRAQDRLRQIYSPERLTAQVLSMIARAEAIAAGAERLTPS